ncbi:trypsin-like peptidase domain-containing protein [Micromonospora sediminicola]|uniref:VMAP-C domain-containing protein n=1 Tax=Micromonospora sediminicola TaxID=946078 RepID=UPI0033FA8C63
MTAWHQRCSDLVEDCLVRVGSGPVAASIEGGSGVWVAPGFVVTCAHLVPDGADSAVEVRWRDQVLRGTVTDQVPAEPGHLGLWAYPDLALVEVADPPEHPCAWLSESVPHDAAPLTAFGHSAKLGEGLRPAAVEGRFSGWHLFGHGRNWQFTGNEIAPGMSGGPVLDTRGGAVCAIVTTTVAEDTDRGGYLAPVAALRELPADRWRVLMGAHDRFHARDQRWGQLRGQQAAQDDRLDGPCGPLEEMELLGLLAELPAPDSATLQRLFAICTDDARPPVTPLLALRDVATTLWDVPAADPDRLLPLLRMTHELSLLHDGTRAGRELRDWTTILATRLNRLNELRTWRATRTATAAPRGVISLQIVPGYAKVDRYRLTMTVHGPDREPRRLYCDEEPRHTLAQVRQVAQDRLRDALCWLGGAASIEFVVPITLFDEPFDELVPTKPYTNLGRKYQVVLRDYDRSVDAEVRHDWLRRWHQLATVDGDVRWIVCTEALTAPEFSAELEQRPEVTVVALTRRPSSVAAVEELLRVALDAGVPVAVWRRDTCAEHDTGAVVAPCSGQQFREAITASLTATAGLPERVRLLRNRTAGHQPSQSDIHCRGTVLLWDDPGRAEPLAPVLEPDDRTDEEARTAW